MPVAVIISEGRNCGPEIFHKVGETREIRKNALKPNSKVFFRATLVEVTDSGGTLKIEIPKRRTFIVDNNSINARLKPKMRILGYNEKEPFDFK